jgi:serine/threonine-protein kinase
MTPLRSVAWQRLQQIFDAAVDVDPASRPAFLDERCAGDPQLRQQVESLLLHYGGDASRLDAAIDGALAASAFAPNPEAGQRLGPYRIERPLGEGGMGMVYLAVRDDEVYRKQVAIKVLRAGLGSGSMQARFRSERQILAQLDHPNIARLLDGGTTGAGVPYLVMEYVAGEPITSWCDRRSLPLRGRLELFRNVCAAVEYAHAHLVVHRDLKPSNILVTDDGTPKLLDFGIAKLLSGDNGAAFTVPVTEAGLRLMTPEYASPEQVRGDPVTTSCDVYALGVVLYELVTGRRPVTFESRTPIEIERRIADHVPPAPGTGGDLDNIILLALDKDPARRYATVDQLDADVARHLDGPSRHGAPGDAALPRAHVRAAAPAGRRRGGRLRPAARRLRRRDVRRRRAARARARSRRGGRARVATDCRLPGDIFNVSNPGEQRGRTITAQEILDQGAARIRTELADQPLVQATLMDTIGKVYQNLGLYDAARAQIERSVSLRQAALGADALETLQARNDLAEIDRSQSRFDAAEKELRAVLAARERLLPADDPKIAESLNNVGLVLRERNRYKEAEPLLRRALEIRRRTLGDRHVDTTVTMTNLGQVLDSEGRLDEAETVLRQALDIRSATLGSDHRARSTP